MRISDWSSDVCSSDLLMDRLINRRVGLWQHLTQTLDGALLEPLRGLLGQADFTTPYRYLEAILSGPMDGRRRLVERLGAEAADPRSEEHTSLQSLMRNLYAVACLNKQNITHMRIRT